jgi:hypothetical protein
MDIRAYGAGHGTWHKRRGAKAQNAHRPQASMGASLEHLVQCSIADAAVQPDRFASLDRCVVQAEESARLRVEIRVVGGTSFR